MKIQIDKDWKENQRIGKVKDKNKINKFSQKSERTKI